MDAIANAIKQAQTTLYESKPDQEMATDEQVAARITTLSEFGYIPSEAIIEPLRSFLSGRAFLLSGDVGRGKTFLCQCLGIRIYTVLSIVDYGIRQISAWYSWTDGNDICIDDIGTEPIATDYGAKDDIIKTVIAHRSEQQQGKTFITTNLSKQQIMTRYGDRTMSRIYGMCDVYRVEGKDMRIDSAQRKATP